MAYTAVWWGIPGEVLREEIDTQVRILDACGNVLVAEPVKCNRLGSCNISIVRLGSCIVFLPPVYNVR